MSLKEDEKNRHWMRTENRIFVEKNKDYTS